MTIVGAELYDDGLMVWSDMLVRREREPLAIEPMPKVAVLDRSFVVGVAGRDPERGLGNALDYWHEAADITRFMRALADDGSTDRDYLVATDDRQLLTLSGERGEWTDHSRTGFAWIGDSEGRKQLTPFDALQPLSTQDSDMAAVVSESWAMTRANDVVRNSPTDTIGGLLVMVVLDKREGFRFMSAQITDPGLFDSDLVSPTHDLADLHGVLRALLSNGAGLSYQISDLGSLPARMRIDLQTLSQRAVVDYELDSRGYVGRAYQALNGELQWLEP